MIYHMISNLKYKQKSGSNKIEVFGPNYFDPLLFIFKTRGSNIGPCKFYFLRGNELVFSNQRKF